MTQAKKDVFDSGVAERFRDFKAKLVSGWIIFTRKVSGRKKRKIVNEENEDEGTENGQDGEANDAQRPTRMPYQIWGHITKADWEAFVAQKTTPKAVVSSCSNM